MVERIAKLYPPHLRLFKWCRLRHFQVVMDAWPNAKMRRILGGKRWTIVLITEDERLRG